MKSHSNQKNDGFIVCMKKYCRIVNEVSTILVLIDVGLSVQFYNWGKFSMGGPRKSQKVCSNTFFD